MTEKNQQRDERRRWAARYSPIDPLKLHALGAMTVYWNRCELGLFVIFAGVTKIEQKLAFAISHEMGDVTMCNKIKEALDIVEHPNGVKELITETLKAFDINRLNRNQLTHFMPAPGESGTLEFWRQKGPILSPKAFPNDLPDIQRVVQDIADLGDHLASVSYYFLQKTYGNVQRPLPNIIPVPERLWKPDPQGQKEPKSQPQSFQS